jgi:hypothetical protein
MDILLHIGEESASITTGTIFMTLFEARFNGLFASAF